MGRGGEIFGFYLSGKLSIRRSILALSSSFSLFSLFFFFDCFGNFVRFGNDSLPKSIDMVLIHYKSRHTNRLIEKKKKHKSLLRVNCMLHAMSG